MPMLLQQNGKISWILIQIWTGCGFRCGCRMTQNFNYLNLGSWLTLSQDFTESHLDILWTETIGHS